MPAESSDQSEDNEFIKNFNKKFITIPKTIPNLHHLSKNHPPLTSQDIQEIQMASQLNSPNQILASSRAKVTNSHRMKSLEAVSESGDHLENSSTASRLKAKKDKADMIFSNRFSEYKQKLSKSINKLESICEQNFGGLHNIHSELSKHQLSKEQLVEYYAKMLPKNSDLSKILKKYKSPKEDGQKLPKLRSMSLRNIPFLSSQQQKKQRKELKHNKWYIEPEKRFSVSKDKTLYDWRTEEGVRNVICSQELKIKSKEINNLIKEVKQKFNREPIFCKYVRIS